MPLFAKKWSSEATLQGKTVVITGANTGIGKETAKDLYRRGARIVIACRDQKKAEKAVEEIKSLPRDTEYNNDIVIKHLDLSDLSSVRQCAKDIINTEKEIHILINNAGVFGHPERTTKDGFEMHFGVNYLGHFLLTLLLLPTLIKSAPARIVNVSSLMHCVPLLGNRIYLDDLKFERKYYHQTRVYGQSKLANVLFSKELSCRLKDAGISNITTYSLHPGVIATELGRNFDQLMYGFSWLWSYFSRILCKTPEQGAQTTIYCAVEEKLSNESGFYYSDCAPATPSSVVHDEDLRKRLWDDSLKYVELTDYNPFTTQTEPSNLIPSE